jgi:uncharacterized membrane protein
MCDRPRTSSFKAVLVFRWLAAGFFIVAGTMHFVTPAEYRQIIPPSLPMPALLVAISGVAEIAGGAGLLIRRLRRLASIGLILLLIAVFPANIYMVAYPAAIHPLHISAATACITEKSLRIIRNPGKNRIYFQSL